jgi:hypothetical protein
MTSIALASDLDRHLDAEAAERAEVGANEWIKQLRHARVDGQTFRDRFTCRGDSLWWFAEVYLHKERVVVDAFRAQSALERLASDAPAGTTWNLNGTTPLVAHVARQVASSHGIVVDGAARASRRMRQRAKARFHTWTALADRLRPSPPHPAATGGVVAFVHSAFARGSAGDEAYTGPVLRELVARLEPGRLQLVGLGPRTSFRVRGWRDRLREFADPAASALALAPVESFARWRDLADSNQQWSSRGRAARALSASSDLRNMAKLERLDLWPLIEPELEGIATLQFPWSVRAMDEAGAALDALDPHTIVTYAEAGGWGRALMLEARRRGIPSVALQHGFIYRHWLNYRHEPDEAAPSPANAGDRGYPYPDRTLLFDEYAREYLERAGSFPPGSLTVTGSPRLDRLVASARALTDSTRAALRASLGAHNNEAIVMVASKYAQIADAFPALVDAVRSRTDVILVVKPHPAEGPEEYARSARGVPNTCIAPATADLGALTALSSVVVTVNSTAAIEAMVLDVPALVVSLPNNLSPFVEAGVMAGAAEVSAIGPALEGLLYDREMRGRLAAARRAFAGRYGIRADGGAAARAADLIVGLARTHYT